jgi:hypothetical protein
MTHLLALVLMPPDIEDIPAKVAEFIAPYDSNREVEPYRNYFPEEWVRGWAKRFRTGTDLQALLKHMKNTPWGKTYLDEQGLHSISTYNPKAKWDYWQFAGGEYMLGEETWAACLAKRCVNVRRGECFICNSCLVSDLPSDLYPVAIVTPDAIWYEMDEFDWEESDEAEAQWQTKALELFQTYSSYRAVGIDCHR